MALIFLGPRKLPQIAKTLGKTLNEFRNTTNEFKATWEREVNFEEEEHAIRTGELPDTPVARMTPVRHDADSSVSAPEIKQIDKTAFDDFAAVHAEKADIDTSGIDATKETRQENPPSEKASLSDKSSWL